MTEPVIEDDKRYCKCIDRRPSFAEFLAYYDSAGILRCVSCGLRVRQRKTAVSNDRDGC